MRRSASSSGTSEAASAALSLVQLVERHLLQMDARLRSNDYLRDFIPALDLNRRFLAVVAGWQSGLQSVCDPRKRNSHSTAIIRIACTKAAAGKHSPLRKRRPATYLPLVPIWKLEHNAGVKEERVTERQVDIVARVHVQSNTAVCRVRRNLRLRSNKRASNI